jgi:transcriptional regulator with XRE-family HTH domain
MSKTRKSFPKMYGNNIKAVMKQKGIILQELSDRSGIGVSYLCNIVNNNQNISLAFAFDIANVLDEPIEKLFIRHKPIEYKHLA